MALMARGSEGVFTAGLYFLPFSTGALADRIGVRRATTQDPKGEEGRDLGFGHPHSIFSALRGLGISGYLRPRYCSETRALTPEHLPGAYAGAHVLWSVLAGMGRGAAVTLFLYDRITRRIDARRGGHVLSGACCR
jgi:hypothetical protein